MDDIKKTVTNLNVVKSEKKEFNWKDPLDLDSQFSEEEKLISCLLYTSPSPRDGLLSRMPSSA